MVYRTQDGKEFAADSHEELAHALWNSLPGSAPTLMEWVEDTARRAETAQGVALRIDSPAHLIADMLSCGLIEEIKG